MPSATKEADDDVCVSDNITLLSPETIATAVSLAVGYAEARQRSKLPGRQSQRLRRLTTYCNYSRSVCLHKYPHLVTLRTSDAALIMWK